MDEVTTTECPACFGEGVHDHRDADAWFGEHSSDAELQAMRDRGMVHPVGITPCTECEGTGVVTVERARDLRAAAVAAIDQIAARVAAEEERR